MTAYIIRRLLLIVPTLFAIMLINFVIIQTAPGGPVEQVIAQLTGEGAAITERVTQSGARRNVRQADCRNGEPTAASTAARRDSTRSSSRSWRNSSASTSRCMSASCRC